MTAPTDARPGVVEVLRAIGRGTLLLVVLGDNGRLMAA